MKNVAYQLLKCLSNSNNTYKFDLSKVLDFQQLRFLLNISPDVLIYVPGPSISSFFLLRIMKLLLSNPKTVIYATHPKLNALSYKLIPYVRPDLILTLSKNVTSRFIKSGCTTEFFPVSVDTEKFHHVSTEEKKVLREKYGIDKSKFVILHVGSIKKGRNVLELADLNDDNIEVVIVGSVTPGFEKDILISLSQTGCKVFFEYIPNIQEMYALSDCYIFPTPPENNLNAIEIPLSVLEAMSCNLPVITTKFGGLMDIFSNVSGLYFIDSPSEIITNLGLIIKSKIEVCTRSEILKYSLRSKCGKLERLLVKL